MTRLPTFRSFSETTREDWETINREQASMFTELPDRILDHLKEFASEKYDSGLKARAGGR